MRKLIWRIRFTKQMCKRLGFGWWVISIGWEFSQSWIDDLDGLEMEPDEAANEELLEWRD